MRLAVGGRGKVAIDAGKKRVQYCNARGRELPAL
jgi:hypothetical protein